MARSASGIKVARAQFRLLCGTWEPVTPMLRETRKGQPPERQSTDAGYRDGATSSVRWAARYSGGFKSLWRSDEGRHIQKRG